MKKIKRPLSFLLSLVMIVSVLYFSPTKVTADGENENIIDEITVYETGASSTAYIDWEYEGESGTVYCGNSAKSYGAIQLRSKKNNSSIVSTETKGFIRKITIIWGDTYNNDNKDVIVYGSQTPYDNASDLYDSGTRGTQLGYLGYNDAEYDADRDLYYNVLTVNDNYRYVGIRSSSGALYLDTVYFEWEPNSYKQEWVWEDDYSNARLTLTEGGEILFSADADSVDSAVTKEPSYLEYGEKTYTARLEYDGVTYMDKVTESIPKLVFEGTVEYIDESGEPADSPAGTIMLTGEEEELNTGWYAVVEDITFGYQVDLHGDVRIIVCDGASASIQTRGFTFGSSEDTLTIYGQSDNSGKLIGDFDSNETTNVSTIIDGDGSLVVNGGKITEQGKYNTYAKLYAGSIVINGGYIYNCDVQSGSFITINGGDIYLHAWNAQIRAFGGDVTVNGGKVDIGTGNGIECRKFYFNGGQANLHGSYSGVYNHDDLATLTWNNEDDEIYCYRYGNYVPVSYNTSTFMPTSVVLLKDFLTMME